MNNARPSPSVTKEEENSMNRRERRCRKRSLMFLFTILFLVAFQNQSMGLSDRIARVPSDRIKKDPKGTMVAARAPKRGSADASLEGRSYFTRANIWYENPKRIYSTNYHVGAIIPVGTEVHVARLTDLSIAFRAADTGMTYKMTLVRKHSTITLKELFDRYFSEENVLAEHGRFYRFTEEERENIKNGTIALGMNRDAVLMAYGYPPSHITPRLSVNVWTYWRSRFQKLVVTFEDDKVIRITH